MQSGSTVQADEAFFLASRPTVASPAPLPHARLWWICAWVSLALHAAAVTYVVNWTPDGLGAIEEESEAISIEVSLSSVVEQAEPIQEPEEASAAKSAAEAPGVIAASEVIEEIETHSMAAESVTESVVAREVAGNEDEPIENVVAGGSDSTHPSNKAPRAEPEQRHEAPPRRQKTTAEPVARPIRSETKPAAEGGPASRATVAAARAEARISASTGNVLAYAARIRARVAGHRPAGRGFRGRVVVAFGVTAQGGLAFASLRRSSGNTAIDTAALQAVHRASPFPPPPPGTPQSRLSFSVPFEFR